MEATTTRQAPLLVVALAMGLCVVTPAHADFISYSTIYDVTSGGGTQVEFQQFDAVLGTLVSAEIWNSTRGYLAYAVDSDYYTSTSSENAILLFCQDGLLYYGGQRIDLGPDDDGPGFDVGGSDYSDAGYFSFDWRSIQLLPITVAPGDLSQYIGTGTVASGPFTWQPTEELAMWPDDMTQYFEFNVLSHEYLQRWTITYEYTPAAGPEEVPEPGTLALLACGLGAGVLRRWRRR